MNRINAVILDWAGTTVDFGSFAPTQIFVEAFRQAFAVEITLEEARVPMGLGKWQHIAAADCQSRRFFCANRRGCRHHCRAARRRYKNWLLFRLSASGDGKAGAGRRRAGLCA